MKNGTLQNYKLSFGKIAKVTGISETQVHGILNGTRHGHPLDVQKVRSVLEENGMPEEEIRLFPCYTGGSEMLLELLQRDVFNPSLTEKKDVYESQSFRIALGMMREAITLRRFVAIIGQTGSGKTNLVRYLQELSHTDSSVIICDLQNHDFVNVRIRHIYEALLYDIQPDTPPKRTTEALIRQVKQILISLHKEGKKVVLIVDEAHHIYKHTLLALKDVWESTLGFSRLLGIILLGQEALGQKLDEGSVVEVNNRVTRIKLESVGSADECKAYITHLAELRDIELNGAITDEAYEEILKKRNNFLGVNVLIKDAIEVALRAESTQLSAIHFKNL